MATAFGSAVCAVTGAGVPVPPPAAGALVAAPGAPAGAALFGSSAPPPHEASRSPDVVAVPAKLEKTNRRFITRFHLHAMQTTVLRRLPPTVQYSRDTSETKSRQTL